MKDAQMKRGKFQSLYRYLPKRWIDFSVRGKTRKNYSAHVIRWNSEKITDINQVRLIRLVNNAVHNFSRQVEAASSGDMKIPATIGFGAELTPDNCDVCTPIADEQERGIVAEVSPLTFFCQKCGRVRQYTKSSDYLSNYNNQRCSSCDVELIQIRQIYFCKCGWASDKHSISCSNKEHGRRSIKRFDSFNFVCTKCNTKIPMMLKCETCGAMCYPKNVLDSSQYFPFSMSIIDIIDTKVEKFINNTDYGAYLAIAYWLEKITGDQLLEVINNGVVIDESVYKKKFDELYLLLKPSFGDAGAKTAAEMAARNFCGSGYIDEISWVKEKIIINSKEEIEKLAEMVIEYDMVLKSQDTSNLDDAINIARFLNTSAKPEEFRKVAEKYAVNQTQVCGKIPFVFSSYGYTREKVSCEKGVQLRAFPETRGRKNIYATKLDTEGVIFELDRKKIIQWLLKNEYISVADAPDMEDNVDIKIWFINNIKLSAIQPFSDIDESENKITYYVYRLIHSISHLLIRKASELCGLDKNSLSEYIFPAIPSVLIYCQNSQGFNLGALFNIFEAYFDQWLKGADIDSKKCIFDPICLERYKACTGCLFLNEVSCQHFNKDLDRSLVVGFYDKKEKKGHKGFWEVD
jgi:hypothetical protein